MVGVDPIAGVSGNCHLTQDLINLFTSYRLFNLNHFKRKSYQVPDPSYWEKATDLGLIGIQKDEWQSNTHQLNLEGIRLNNKQDCLIQENNPVNGQVTAHWAYLTLVDYYVEEQERCWHKKLWKQRFPLKIKCFIWLLFNNKILTWENLQRRGKHGPSICLLCKSEEDSVCHLFFKCNYTLDIWRTICKLLKIDDGQPCMDFYLAYQLWIIKYRNLKTIPGLLAWAIWKTRNMAIFQDINPIKKQTLGVFWNLFHSYSYLPKVNQTFIKNIFDIPMELGKVIGVFDGASTIHTGGAGFTIRCGVEYLLKFQLACGSATNTEDELLGLWGVLKVAAICGIDSLIFYGDSLVVINWENKQAKLENTQLYHWCSRIAFLVSHFVDLSINHVYRENNDVADTLSKEALDGDPGVLLWEEWIHGSCAHSGSISSFLSEGYQICWLEANLCFVLLFQMMVQSQCITMNCEGLQSLWF